MALAVLAVGLMRLLLPPELRISDASGVFVVLLGVLVLVLIVGDPGRIDRQARWLRLVTGSLIGLITIVNAGSSVRLVVSIVYADPFTQTARVLLECGGIIWLTNVVAFGLWYWDLDRGGAAARAAGSDHQAGVRLSRDDQSGVCRRGLVTQPRRLPAPVVHHRDGVQPHRRLADQALGQADDDDRGGDLPGRRASWWSPGP